MNVIITGIGSGFGEALAHEHLHLYRCNLAELSSITPALENLDLLQLDMV